MPNLYFCESENQSHGMLRAVLPWDTCNRMVKQESAIYLGVEFPSRSIEGACRPTVAILHVLPEEASEQWPAGFYRLDADVLEIDTALQTTDARLPNKHCLHLAAGRK
jgi:hypothetical protein